jgi:cation:H+ antiporter
MELASLALWQMVVVGVIALALLVLSADYAVKKSIGLAAYFHLSSTFMGVTVISIATSIPEITAHLTASVGIIQGSLDYKVGSSIVLGANIGSDVVQQTLILGLVVFLSGALYFRKYFLWKTMIPMILTSLLCIILGFDRVYSNLDGAILFGLFVLYMYYLYLDERKHYKEEDNLPKSDEVANGIPQNGREALRDTLLGIVALGVTILSATYVLQITEIVVDRTGIGGSLIGVLTLGVASAMPELITALSGVNNKETGISLGALIGSNITNPLLAIGGGAMLSTYYVPRPLIYWDLPWATLTGAFLWAILWFSGGKLKRWSAFYLMGIYFVYILTRAIFFAVD